MVKQTSGDYATKDITLAKYQALVRSLLSTFTKYTLVQVDRENNNVADLLSKLVDAKKEDLEPAVYFEELKLPTIEGHQIMEVHEEDITWMAPIIDYLKEDILPNDPIRAKQLRVQAAKYFLQDTVLYKRTFDAPILKCIDMDEASYVMREIHEGICGNHMGGKALTHKVIRQGYFCPTLAKDCKEFVQKCGQCQLFSNVPKQAPSLPSSILSPIPFAMWGIDIIGPFPKARGELQFLIVAVDYMTKWAEAKALRTITQEDAIKFVNEHIITRFGIPRVIVSDKGTQFVGAKFAKFLSYHGIKHKKSSVCHPQSNGQVEVTNRTIVRSIEKCLQTSKKKWPEELHKVLWAYRTTARTSTNETPFKLSFGTEALLPVEVGSPSFRLLHFEEQTNTEGLRTNMEFLDEVRDDAVRRMEIYKEKTKTFFARKTRLRSFDEGDLVLRAAEASDPRHTGKLMPKWEGPYKVKHVLNPGTYKLQRMDGTDVNNTWNGEKLRKFYT